jgi:hypothetical protein
MKYLLLIPTIIALTACGKSTTPADPLHAMAVDTCKATIASRATNIRTLNYRSVDVKPGQGQLIVSIDFSAANEVGLTSSMLARCVTSADGKALVDIAVNSR